MFVIKLNCIWVIKLRVAVKMELIKPPKALSMKGNVQENWKVWKQNFNFYLLATESTEKETKIKSGLFLHTVGEEGRRLYHTLTFEADADKLTYI